MQGPVLFSFLRHQLLVFFDYDPQLLLEILGLLLLFLTVLSDSLLELKVPLRCLLALLCQPCSELLEHLDVPSTDSFPRLDQL